MITLELGDQIYSWQGSTQIIDGTYYQVNSVDKLNVIELKGNGGISGVVLVGKVSIIVDTIIYTQSHGAIGETTEYVGSSLAILGLELSTLKQFLQEEIFDSEVSATVRREADQLISKLKDNLTNKSTNIQFEKDSDINYIIFGKSNLFLIGSTNEFVVIHKKKISVRKGENSLVQVDPIDGIVIANREKCLRIGSQSQGKDLSFLGNLGVNFASKILDAIVWD